MNNKYGIKVGMLILLESDLDKAVSFYEKLGFTKKFHIQGQWAEFILGDVKIGLCPASQDLPDHHTGIVLEVPDLYSVYNELKSEGIFVSEPKTPEHGIIVSMKDPGNNIIDLYQPTPERIQEILNKVAAEGKEKKDCCGSKENCEKADC